jgi:hypothetical protein
MTTRNVLLWLHISAIAAWLGANFVQLVLSPYFEKMGGGARRGWTEATNWLGTRYYAAAGVVILATGAGLVLKTPYDVTAGFVGLGIFTVVLGAAMGGAVFAPLTKKRLAGIDAGDEAVAKSTLRRITLAGLFDTALVLTTVLAMVYRWKA